MLYYIHYPSGGFGHFMLQMISICFDDVFCPQEHSSFSEDGNSHSYPVHYKTWSYKEPSEDVAFYDFKDKKSICLIDSGIDDDVDKKMPNTIRMCIDKNARSIIFQTCREKAERSTLDIIKTDIDWEKSFVPKVSDWSNLAKCHKAASVWGYNWEKREKYTKLYRYADQNIDFYLNKWQPAADCTNISISDLFFNPVKLLKQLEPHFGKCNWGKFWKLWNEFTTANQKYYQAQHLVNRVKHALEADFNFEFKKDYSLHDQGYLTYWLEKQYNIQEIPPNRYKDWFKNTQEVRDCLNSIHLQ